ncbi:hypothetical protein ACJZ2D_004879 [Fusarium nematophilum]
MPSPIRPKRLQPGSTIAFISPSARLNDDFPAVMSRATNVLLERGYQVKTLWNKDKGIQSSISNRLSEIRAAFSDPQVSAIITTIGGPSFNELLPALIADTELQAIIRKDPKIVVGYSDITGLHWFLHSLTGLRTFYGPCPIPELGEANLVHDKESPLAFCVENLFRAIESPEPLGKIPRSLKYAPGAAPIFRSPPSSGPPSLVENPGWTWIRPGKARGRLFGGCLTVVARLQAVPAIVPDWRGRVVFLETAMSDEEISGIHISRVRAGFADLIAHGTFEEAAGLVVGRPFGYESKEAREEYMGVIRELLCEGRLAERKFPILFGVDFGHMVPMVTLPYDALAELDSEDDSFTVLEPGVE